jgi:DNA-binding CsgD family transcriptional regulator
MMSGKSVQLRLIDVRRAMRLVGECRDHGDAAEAWVAFAAEGLRGLVGARVVFASLTPPEGFRLFRTALVTADSGLDGDAERLLWSSYTGSEPQLNDPAYKRLLQFGSCDFSSSRRQLIEDRELSKSPNFVRCSHPLRLDDYVITQRKAPDGASSLALNPHRARGDARFSERDIRLVSLYHDELQRLLGAVLTDGRDDPAAGLPPRLRQTLDGLLTGDSAKQIALRLGLSRYTVEDYIQALYRRFAVSSRAELVARFVRRSRGNPAE